MPLAKRKKAADGDGCEPPKIQRKGPAGKGKIVYRVFFLGFSDEEASFLKEGAPADFVFTEDPSSDITHIVLNPSACAQSLPWPKIYLGIVSRIWLVRPSWLKDVKNVEKHSWGAKNLEIQYAPRESEGPSLLKLVKLYAKYVKSEVKPFAAPIFGRVVLLSSGTEDEDLVRDIRSIIEMGGGALASNNVEEEISVRPKETKSMVSVAVYFPGYEPNQLTKQLLSSDVPVISHEIVLQTVENTVPESEEVLLKKSVEHWKNLGFFSSGTKGGVEKSTTRPKRKVVLALEPPTFLGCVRLGKSSTDAFRSLGEEPAQYQPLEKLLENMKMGSKILRQSVASQNDFKDTIAELEKLNIEDEIQEIRAVTAVAMVRNSDNDYFLPAPSIVSFLLHLVASNQSADAREASSDACGVLAALIDKFPPYSSDSRSYWRKALSKYHREPAKSGRRSVTTTSAGDWKESLRDVLEKVVRSPSGNVNLLGFVVRLLEAELFFLDKNQYDKLEGPKRLVPDDSNFHDVGLDLPMFYSLFYEVYDIRTIGINNKAMELFDKISAALGDAMKQKSLYLLQSLARLQTICLESLHFAATKKGQPLAELEQDVRRVLRRCIGLFPPTKLMKLLPGEWISKLIGSVNDSHGKLAA